MVQYIIAARTTQGWSLLVRNGKLFLLRFGKCVTFWVIAAEGTIMMKPSNLFWRALGAFLALPAFVAFLIPWLLRPAHPSIRWWGLALLFAGTILLLWCVRDFYVAGRGTLAPWSPPERLVTVGLYRVSRNPMYVAVLLILCGWALTFASTTLWIYAAVVAVAFHLRVVLNEEPFLARTHGDEWRVYRARVPRWLGWPRGDAGDKVSSHFRQEAPL